jgi:ABC-type multidrug transport system fused ATPase/permease subunit
LKVLKRLFKLLGPYWKVLLLSAVLLLAHTGIELVPPLIQRRIIDQVIELRDVGLLGPLVGWLVGVYAAQHLVSIGDNYVRHVVGERFILDLRVRLYDYLQRLSLSFFEKTSTGELMSRVTNDVNALEHFVTHGSAFALANLLRLLGAAVLLFTLDWQLTLWVLAPVPVLALGLRLYNQRARPVYRSVRDRLGDINARLQDSLAGIKVIQAFGQEERELERFAQESKDYYHTRVRSIRYWSTFFPAIGFVASWGTVAVLGAGAWLVLQGRMSIGTLVAFLSYLNALYGPIHTLVEVDDTFQQAIGAGERVFELLDEDPEIVDAPDAVDLPPLQGHVSFEHVYFGYSTGDQVLRDVTFDIAPGEMVALVGRSGAGKTSIANLLCRFYDPLGGCVRVDGTDLRHVTRSSLRRQTAVVLQDTFLFNSTVRENLLYGQPNASDAEMVAAAKAAYAHEFIAALPKGYDTEIGERGVRLSGGQKQRLALARAILADPRILILDEATSSVDAEAEYLIQQALDSVLKGRTALVIAHRLSTIRNASKIIALEEGRILEIGDHGELMERQGLYSQLYRRQLELADPV